MRDASIPNTTGSRLTMTKPITNAVSHAFQALERDIGSIGADSVYDLIKAVIIEQSLPDEPGPEVSTGIEVEERQFDSPEELVTHVKQVMGELK